MSWTLWGQSMKEMCGCRKGVPTSDHQTLRQESVHCVPLFATPVAHQAPLSMGFCKQEYRSGEPLLSPGDLPNPGIEPGSPTLQVFSLPSEPPGRPQRKDGSSSLGPGKEALRPNLPKLSTFNILFDPQKRQFHMA